MKLDFINTYIGTWCEREGYKDHQICDISNMQDLRMDINSNIYILVSLCIDGKLISFADGPTPSNLSLDDLRKSCEIWTRRKYNIKEETELIGGTSGENHLDNPVTNDKS